MFKQSIHGQFVNNSWTFMFQKDDLSSFVFVSSSPFLSLPLFLSFFNVHPMQTSNSLKTKDLRKRHFWLQIFESMETANTQNVRYKIRPIFFSLPRRPYTPHAARNWPYMLCRETLHYVGFHVGFADPTIHTQHRWLSNLKPALCRICRECINPLKTV